jgi:hypothetical protein
MPQARPRPSGCVLILAAAIFSAAVVAVVACGGSGDSTF